MRGFPTVVDSIYRHFHSFNENNAIFAPCLLSFTDRNLNCSHVQVNTYSIVHYGMLYQNANSSNICQNTTRNS